MKIFLISDIHGSVFYLKEALKRYKEEAADYIVILGDELYHGARNPLPEQYNPQETAKLLNEYADRIIAVRGNCDSEVDELVLNYPIMSTYSTILYRGRRLFLTHGHIYNEDNLPPLSKGDVFMYGHIHIPIAKKHEGLYIINPGSITFPKNGSVNSYAILEVDRITIKDLSGNEIKSINLE